MIKANLELWSCEEFEGMKGGKAERAPGGLLWHPAQ